LHTAKFFFAMTDRGKAETLKTESRNQIRHLTPTLSPFEAERVSGAETPLVAERGSHGNCPSLLNLRILSA